MLNTKRGSNDWGLWLSTCYSVWLRILVATLESTIWPSGGTVKAQVVRKNPWGDGEVVNCGQIRMVRERRRRMRRTCEAEQTVMYLHWRELSASSLGVGTYPILAIKWVISVEASGADKSKIMWARMNERVGPAYHISMKPSTHQPYTN